MTRTLLVSCLALCPVLLETSAIDAGGITTGIAVETINSSVSLASYATNRFSLLWDSADPLNLTGLRFSEGSDAVMQRSTTTDGGITWSEPVTVGVVNPVYIPDPGGEQGVFTAASQKSPVVRDLGRFLGESDGHFTAFLGAFGGTHNTAQVPSPPGTGKWYDELLFMDTTQDLIGAAGSWNGTTAHPGLRTHTYFSGLGPGGTPFAGHTGMNAYAEVFRVPSDPGKLRGYTVMNNRHTSGSQGVTLGSSTHLVESSDGGDTWAEVADMNIVLADGRNWNPSEAGSDVFQFKPRGWGDENLPLLGMFGVGLTTGVNEQVVTLLVSSDEGLTWNQAVQADGITPVLQIGSTGTSQIRGVDVHFLSDTTARFFFHHRNALDFTYQDFSLAGMGDIIPNNLYGGSSPLLLIPEPATVVLAALGLLTALGGRRRRRSFRSNACRPSAPPTIDQPT